MRLANCFWLPRKEKELQTFLQNRPAYLTLLVLILCFIFCLAPLSAAAADKPSGMDFAAQFDQFAPDDSAHPPARQITKSRVNIGKCELQYILGVRPKIRFGAVRTAGTGPDCVKTESGRPRGESSPLVVCSRPLLPIALTCSFWPSQ